MIEVKDVSKSYKKKQVLQHISFQVACGERVAIVGKNGCGKSTLLQIMAGVLKPDSGEITYFGNRADGKSRICRQFCGYVPQENPLLEELSVKDNLKLWGAGKKEAVRRVVEQFHLEEMLQLPVEKLSGGMKRRLSIACALIEWPPVLLLDEPTTALDIYYKENISQWLTQYQKMNGIVVMTTHEEKEILSADRCLVIYDGNMKELVGSEINMQEIQRYIVTD